MITINVFSLHESAKLQLGITIINKAPKHPSIKDITNDAPVFFNGSFEFIGIEFKIVCRGTSENAWAATICYDYEVLQNQCFHCDDTSLDNNETTFPMLIYIAQMVIDAVKFVLRFFGDRFLDCRMKIVDQNKCIAIPGLPEQMKLIIIKMESTPILLNDILESAINDIAKSNTMVA